MYFYHDSNATPVVIGTVAGTQSLLKHVRIRIHCTNTNIKSLQRSYKNVEEFILDEIKAIEKTNCGTSANGKCTQKLRIFLGYLK